MVCETGRRTDAAAPTDWSWRGRRVLIVDGSTVTMPDTPASQREYPQPKSQKPGCGFPIARIIVVFLLATGVVLDAAIGKYKGKRTGENSMFRTLHESVLALGDVVLADHYFSGWFDIAMLQMRGASVCVRKHQLRKDDFPTGQRLGSYDHVVAWTKPQRPKWMSRELYETMPNELVLREVRVVVEEKGFRTRKLVVVTTMLDADECPAEEVGELYRRRWRSELHLRSIKTVLQMDRLRSKTPEQVRKEFWMHLLGYNLIRGVMAHSAMESKTQPWRISFKGTLQTLSHFLPLLVSSPPEPWCDTLLRSIASHVVGNRPGHHEPRLVKRRAKPYKYLQKLRRQYRNSCSE
jgi:putative transposase